MRPLLLSFSLRLVLLACVALLPATARAQNDPESRRAAIDAMYPVMLQALAAKSYGSARNICDQAILWEPQNPVHHYNLACIEAQTGARRFPQAFAALEQAVALGFKDTQHLQADPDLAPLRGDPRFAAILHTLSSVSPTATATAPVATASSAPSAAARPPRAGFQDGMPVGLYFMTRFWGATGSLEKAAWYFAPDGNVYQNLRHGFSSEDLAAHAGRKGKARGGNGTLEVTWATGKTTSAKLSRDGTGFGWDAGLFAPVEAYRHAAEVVGTYEGGESLAGASERAAVAKRLELRADGTFIWNGVSFLTTASHATEISAGSTTGSQGRWELSGLSLILTAESGKVFRGIVFPYDDAKTPAKPDRMFFGGLMYKKR